MGSGRCVSQDYFKKRLVELCLRSGLSDFPKNFLDRQIFMKSVALFLDNTKIYSENEINETLGQWFNICRIQHLDHITLRRMLVDAGYLTRERDGSCYQVSPSSSKQNIFAEDIEEIDVIDVIQSGEAEIIRRKMEYKNKKQS